MPKPRFAVPDRKPAEPSLKEILRNIGNITAGQLAAMDNVRREYQEPLGRMGITIIVAAFDAHPQSPFWNAADTGEPFKVELAAAKAGEFDSVRMLEGIYLAYYYASKSQLAKTLAVLKKGFKDRNLLKHARLYYIEAESGNWVTVWPATAEVLDTTQ